MWTKLYLSGAVEALLKVAMRFHAANDRPTKDQYFVFGSNLRGAHGAGAARHAVDHYGAEYGNPIGLQGRSYALPTKDRYIKTLPINDIVRYIQIFKQFTLDQPNKEFFVTAVGTGLAGYRHEDIAPWFIGCGDNCIFPVEWREYMSEGYLNALYAKYIS